MDFALPEDVMGAILESFCPLSTFAKLELCSKALFRQEVLWKHFQRLVIAEYTRCELFGIGPHEARKRWIRSVAPLEAMTRLTFVVVERLTSDQLSLLEVICWNHVIHLNYESNTGLYYTLTQLNWKNLESLELRFAVSSSSTEEDAPHEILFEQNRVIPRLRKLFLQTPQTLPTVLEAVARCCPAIELLEIPRFSSGGQLETLRLELESVERFLDACPTLKLINLSNWDLSDRTHLICGKLARSPKVITKTGALCLSAEPATVQTAVDMLNYIFNVRSRDGEIETQMLDGMQWHDDFQRSGCLVEALQHPDVVAAILRIATETEPIPPFKASVIAALNKSRRVTSSHPSASEKAAVPLELIKTVFRGMKRPLNHIVQWFELDDFIVHDVAQGVFDDCIDINEPLWGQPVWETAMQNYEERPGIPFLYFEGDFETSEHLLDCAVDAEEIGLINVILSNHSFNFKFKSKKAGSDTEEYLMHRVMSQLDKLNSWYLEKPVKKALLRSITRMLIRSGVKRLRIIPEEGKDWKGLVGHIMSEYPEIWLLQKSLE